MPRALVQEGIMNSKSMRRAWMFGPVLSLSVALASCSGPVPAGTGANGGNGNGTGTGSGNGGFGTGTNINLNPGATSTKVSTGTEITEGQNCGVTSHDTTKQPVDLLLVLDRSESMNKAMNEDGNCDPSSTDCRWPTMKSALSKVFASSIEMVNWGLKLYSTPSQGNCAVSDGVDVPIAAGSTSSINDMINQVTPGGNTPTRKAVAAGVEYLKTLTTPGSKSILLATDGQPNCKGTSTNTTSDVAAATDAIKAAAAAGFKVYILGIGPDSFTDTLNGFAEAGGTSVANVGGTGKNYYAAVSAEELSKNFNSIVGTVASCSLKLDSKPQVPSNIAVEFDGDKSLRAPQSKTDGWDYTSATSIQLYGSWCDRLTNGTFKSVKVLFGCSGQIIP
jgi:hypothetical protein